MSRCLQCFVSQAFWLNKFRGTANSAALRTDTEFGFLLIDRDIGVQMLCRSRLFMPSRRLKAANSHTRGGKLTRAGAGTTMMRAETPKDQPTIERNMLLKNAKVSCSTRRWLQFLPSGVFAWTIWMSFVGFSFRKSQATWAHRFRLSTAPFPSRFPGSHGRGGVTSPVTCRMRLLLIQATSDTHTDHHAAPLRRSRGFINFTAE